MTTSRAQTSLASRHRWPLQGGFPGRTSTEAYCLFVCDLRRRRRLSAELVDLP